MDVQINLKLSTTQTRAWIKLVIQNGVTLNFLSLGTYFLKIAHVYIFSFKHIMMKSIFNSGFHEDIIPQNYLVFYI